MEAKYPDETLHFPFKHDNWEDFVRHMDKGSQTNYYDRDEEMPKFGLVWLGKRVMTQFQEFLSYSGVIGVRFIYWGIQLNNKYELLCSNLYFASD